MSRVTQHFLSNRVSKITQVRWLWRATAIALLLVAGFGVRGITMRAPLAAHAVSPSQAHVIAGAPIDARAATSGSGLSASQPQRFDEAAEPYASDHLDAYFVDFAHPEPLTPESIREMALTRFLGLSSVEREGHARR